jgi:hypothetical protein
MSVAGADGLSLAQITNHDVWNTTIPLHHFFRHDFWWVVCQCRDSAAEGQQQQQQQPLPSIHSSSSSNIAAAAASAPGSGTLINTFGKRKHQHRGLHPLTPLHCSAPQGPRHSQPSKPQVLPPHHYPAVPGRACGLDHHHLAAALGDTPPARGRGGTGYGQHTRAASR